MTGCTAGNVTIAVSLSDVRESAGLGDYTGELQGVLPLRTTDKHNGTSPASGTDPATVADTALRFAVPCVPTDDAAVGASCGVSTTANAVSPAAVASGFRTIWELGQIEVWDGGSDGVASTSPNVPFARQGIFLP